MSTPAVDPTAKQSYWREEPARLGGQVAALLGLLAASGLQISDNTTAAITSLTAGVAALLGAYFLRTKVTSPATHSRIVAAVRATQQAHLDDGLAAMYAAAEPAPGADGLGDAPYGLHPLDSFPELPPPGPATLAATASRGLMQSVEYWHGAYGGSTEPEDEPTDRSGEVLAEGVHDHPTRKLGRRPPSGGPALMLADHLTGALPEHPVADVSPDLVWPMDKNDEWGDCVVAGLDHSLQAIYTALEGSYTNWSEAEILAMYRTQNPHFDPSGAVHGPGSADDGGMDIQAFLGYLVKQGLILGFAKVDPSNADEVAAAIWLGLAVVTGEDLRQAQQDQTVWDYVHGSPDWGGHCTTWVGYGDGRTTCVTWGEAVDMTQSFIDHQVSEAWFILTHAHVTHPGFRQGFDLSSYAAAYTAITGRAFPVVIDPPTPPGPQPQPTPPVADTYEQAVQAYPSELATIIERRAKSHNLSPVAYLVWLAAKDAKLRAPEPS